MCSRTLRIVIGTAASIVALTAFGVAGAVASGVPLVGNMLVGRLPLPVASTT